MTRSRMVWMCLGAAIATAGGCSQPDRESKADTAAAPPSAPAPAAAATTSDLVATLPGEACPSCVYRWNGSVDPDSTLDPGCDLTGLHEAEERVAAIVARGAACPEGPLLEALSAKGSADLWNAGGKVRKDAIAARITLLAALADRGGPETLRQLEDDHFDDPKHLHAARDRARAAIWERLATRAAANVATPPRIAFAVRIFAWRPEHLPIDRLVTEQLREGGFAPMPADAGDVDALLVVTYREYASDDIWHQGRGTVIALEGNLVDLHGKRVTRIAISGSSTGGQIPNDTGDREALASTSLYESAADSFRWHLPELVDQLRAGL
jgi:hypothetical protein